MKMNFLDFALSNFEQFLKIIPWFFHNFNISIFPLTTYTLYNNLHVPDDLASVSFPTLATFRKQLMFQHSEKLNINEKIIGSGGIWTFGFQVTSRSQVSPVCM